MFFIDESQIINIIKIIVLSFYWDIDDNAIVFLRSASVAF